MRIIVNFIFFFSVIISSTPSYSIDELANYKKECSKLGFTEGTEKFGDCVLKLMEAMPSKKIVVEPIGYDPGDIFRDTNQTCLKAKVVNGIPAYRWLRWGADGNCSTSPELNTVYAGEYSGQDLEILYKVEKGFTREETTFWNGIEMTFQEYKNGIPHGVFERYHSWKGPNPPLKEKGQYKDGKQHGDWLYYNKEDKLHQKTVYNMGEDVETICYLPVKKTVKGLIFCPGVFD